MFFLSWDQFVLFNFLGWMVSFPVAWYSFAEKFPSLAQQLTNVNRSIAKNVTVCRTPLFLLNSSSGLHAVHLLWVQDCGFPDASRTHGFLVVIHCFWLFCSFQPLSTMVPSLGRRRCCYRDAMISLRAQNFVVPYYTSVTLQSAVRLCFNHCLLQIEDSPMRAKRCIDLWE